MGIIGILPGMMIDSIEKVILTTSLAAGSPEAIAQTQGSAQIPDGIAKTRSGTFPEPLIFGFGAREDERPGVLCIQPPQPRATRTHRTGPIVPRPRSYAPRGEERCEGQRAKSSSTWDRQVGTASPLSFPKLHTASQERRSPRRSLQNIFE